jgi:hypothetical protein
MSHNLVKRNDIVCHPRATLSYTSGILPKSQTKNSKYKIQNEMILEVFSVAIWLQKFLK